MSTEATEQQGGPERRRSKEISLNRQRPPLDVPGYDPERCLGVGAYGEVWVAVERNTGRRVAIKFYTHSGGLDWSLLSREVEKLSFLFSDRYIVQLLGVGWNAEPPYYIMEYIERGSLAERLRQGPLSVDEAVGIFRGVAIGLVHAHDKGVLHCDLKPANILLDQDGHPRLADFGQSRLSHEQIPSLGTLFYMAPEQARLSEAPDARWDVYALGAVLYCMLTGNPPHRSAELVNNLERATDLQKRLNLYCRSIRKSPLPSEHRRLPGVDRDLHEIVDCCLAPKPEDRFPNVQAVLTELDARNARKARRPMMLLGAIGPALLMLVVFAFALWGFNAALNHSENALTERALLTNEFVAQLLAGTVGDELQNRYNAAESLAHSDDLRAALEKATADASPLHPLLVELSDTALLEKLNETPQGRADLENKRNEFRISSQRHELQEVFTRLTKDLPITEGWFLNDADGVQIARSPQRDPRGQYYHTIGTYYGWRSYFHGGPADEDATWSPPPGQHIRKTHLSDVFISEAIDRWVVTVSAPIYTNNDPKNGRFLGVVSLLVKVGRFVIWEKGENQNAVLADWREGAHKGLILQHPVLDLLLEEKKRVPNTLTEFKVDVDNISQPPCRVTDYHDPLAQPQNGKEPRWLAQVQPVRVREIPTGLAVIVQEEYASGIGGTLAKLRKSMLSYGILALCIIVTLMIGLWTFAMRLQGGRAATHPSNSAESEIDLSPSDTNSPVTPGVDCESPTEPLHKGK